MFSEQQTQTIAGADRVAALAKGRLVVESESETAEVTMSLRGPAARARDLTEHAETLGFRYVIDRP